MSLSFGEVLLGLLAILVVSVPLGSALLRVLEKVTGAHLRLTIPERFLLCPYLFGGLYFVLASLPWPIFTQGLVIGIAVAGVAAFLAIEIGTRSWKTTLKGLSVTRLHAPILVVCLTCLVLVIEVASTGTASFPNSYDGSFQSLYVQVILTHHLIPWTLQPFGDIGIVYPQATAIWLSLPVVLFDWPIPASIVALPLLFLALGVPASYCLGARLCADRPSASGTGPVVVAFGFALLFSWPRLFLGGSFDFAIGLPLFLLALGWIQPFLREGPRPWGHVILFAGMLGVLTSLSVALGEALFLLLGSFLLVRRSAGIVRTLRAWSSRLLIILAAALLSVSRSIAGFVAWFGLPLHTLDALGKPPYAPLPIAPFPAPKSLVQYLDPFTPVKSMLSPFPLLSVEIAILLGIGLIAGALVLTHLDVRLTLLLPRSWVAPVLLGTLTMFVWTAFLMVVSGTELGTSFFNIVASVYESSFLLFIFFQLVATLPLVALLELVGEERRRKSGSPRPQASGPSATRYRHNRRLLPPERWGWKQVGAIALILLPLGSGAIITGTQVPTYLSDHLSVLSNVTTSDVDAMEWVGQHLPPCSRVMVAQGSAAEFLPLYAQVQLLFPMQPAPLNLSYNVASENLIRGTYSDSTEAAMTALMVTEVFATGQTSVSYLPFNVTELHTSSQFTLLYSNGDAIIFGFLLGQQSAQCPS